MKLLESNVEDKVLFETKKKTQQCKQRLGGEIGGFNYQRCNAAGLETVKRSLCCFRQILEVSLWPPWCDGFS